MANGLTWSRPLRIQTYLPICITLSKYRVWTSLIMKRHLDYIDLVQQGSLVIVVSEDTKKRKKKKQSWDSWLNDDHAGRKMNIWLHLPIFHKKSIYTWGMYLHYEYMISFLCKCRGGNIKFFIRIKL